MKKQKKIALIILIFGVIYFFISYRSENKKYEIINEIFNDTDIKPQKICKSEIILDFEKDVFNEFSLFDKLSVYSQVAVKNIRSIINLKSDVKANKIFYKDDLGKSNFSEILLKCSANKQKVVGSNKIVVELSSLNAISLPILSSDNKTAVMQIDTHCGSLCGDGYLYVFKKINGKWQVFKKILRWIS